MFDLIMLFKAAILGIIQGLTEFLPVSSTGHMVIVGKLLEFDPEITKTFDVFSQLGATSALIWYYRCDLWQRATKNFKLFFYLLVAFLPVAIVGLLLHNRIESLLDSILSVGIAQILGACLILFAESVSSHFKNKTASLNKISFRQALYVGFWQIISLWPGMSRSGSTIMGGLLSKIDRPTATQFSFYLSIPVSLSSSLLMFVKHPNGLTSTNNIMVLLVGFVFSFVVGLGVISFIMRYVRTHSFVVFAYYRFILGGLILFFVW